MASDGHAANMKVMSAVYHDKNQEALQEAFVGGQKNARQKTATSSSSGSRYVHIISTFVHVK